MPIAGQKMTIPIAKEGYPFCIGFLMLSFMLFFVYYATGQRGWAVLFIFFLALSLFILYFFRDPKRVVPDQHGLVVAPADGKIVEIVEESEPFYRKEKSRRISIFLSVMDVHVNRSPVSGEIHYKKYYPGKFLVAWNPKASLENEQMHIGIQMDGAKVLVKQIAGILARRIISYVQKDQKIDRGERIGIIRFGSRTDIFIPLEWVVKVKIGDKVSGASSVIAEVN